MSKRRAIRDRMQLFSELHDVLDSMKNFALVEISRLTRTQRYRHHLLDELLTISTMTDAFFPRPAGALQTLYIVIGSERGFCGDFNDRILELWSRTRAAEPDASFLVVGAALEARSEALPRVATLAGPLVKDDIDPVMLDVLQHVAPWQRTCLRMPAICVIAHGTDGPYLDPIVPFQPPAPRPASGGVSLNISPTSFMREFIDRYIDAKLHDAFATSLLAENHARLAHMTSAISRVEENLGELSRRSRRQRQEEITQEVETLMLAATPFPSKGHVTC